jgi:hypothetical protein
MCVEYNVELVTGRISVCCLSWFRFIMQKLDDLRYSTAKRILMQETPEVEVNLFIGRYNAPALRTES